MDFDAITKHIANPEVVVPFLTLKKDSTEPVGMTLYWNLPAQLTTADPDVLIRVPILKDGTINHKTEETNK